MVSSTLMIDAGRYLPWGSFWAMISPLSTSATIQALAVSSSGTA